MKLGQKLKNARIKAGLTQKEVEAKLGLRDLTMKDYETERLKLPTEIAAKFADIYKISISELIGENTKPINVSQQKNLFGIESLFQQPKYATIYFDPVIRAYIENFKDQIFKDSLFKIMTSHLSEKQQIEFSIELFKLIASLMGADGKISAEEQTFLYFLMSEMNLNDKTRSVSKAITHKHLPDENSVLWKNAPHLKHFIIWLMYFLAQSDEDIRQEESQFIEECSEKLKVNRSNFLYIKSFFIKDKF